MFRLEHPIYLIALVIIPILIILFFWAIRSKKNAINRLGNQDLIERLMPQFSSIRYSFKFIFIILAIAFLALSWANPQWGSKREKVKRKSADLMIALDISWSMNATDIAPSRLERSKKFARKLVQELAGDRVGVIIFAGAAHLHMPLTIDYSAASLFLDSAHPEQILTQGTSIDAAIGMAELAFEQDNDQHKALIIISDGENHDEKAIAAAKKAHEKGMIIFTIGTGTPEGAYVPIKINNYNDFKRDANGELVRSQLNEEMLTQVAEAGGGKYYNVLSGEEAVLNALKNKVEEIEKREFEERMFDEYESYFWIFLIPAILFLVIEFLISYRKSNILSGRDIFS